MSDNIAWFQLHVNPEPWAVGPVSIGRRNGKMIPMIGRNQQMEAYKEAIKEELGTQEPLPGKYRLDFFFWRRLDVASSGDRRQHQADGTNMAKATEDALQGVLIGNDRDVISASWTIVSQGADIAPGVLVRLEWGLNPLESVRHLPKQLFDEVMGYRHLHLVTPITQSDNSWPPKDVVQ